MMSPAQLSSPQLSMSLSGLSSQHRFASARDNTAGVTASTNLQSEVSHLARAEGWFEKSLTVTETESSVEELLQDVSRMLAFV